MQTAVDESANQYYGVIIADAHGEELPLGKTFKSILQPSSDLRAATLQYRSRRKGEPWVKYAAVQ